MPRKDVARSRNERPPGTEKNCVFCNSSEDNELKYGKIYQYNGIVTHYYCLLLSSNMQQKGSDDEGILGFLTLDILNELKRGKRLACSYCKKIGATLGCCNTKCKKIFHLPCGLKAGSLHQFFDEFRSYCVTHRPKQKIDEKIRAQFPDQLLCYICYDSVDKNNLFETLWAPCCKKNAWFHRLCVQQLAMSAGYFFKCPLCNNKKEFQKAMLDNGIFIPCQDASWELVPNAFQELLYRHNRCDANQCICSKGRRYTSSNPKWELILCRTCGSQGVHVACGRLKWGNATWDCRECSLILKKTEESGEESRMSENSTPSLDPSAKDDSSQSDSDGSGSDSDISVGVEEPVYGPTPWPAAPDSPPKSGIRPGPKSFKLKQQKMLRERGDDSLGGTSSDASNPQSDSLSAKAHQVNHKFSREPSMSIPQSQSTPKAATLPGSSNSPEELVIIDSDDEFLPEKSEPPLANITENVLMTNNEITIPVQPLSTSLPNGLRLDGEVRLQTGLHLPVMEPTYMSAAIMANQSIGHIAVGPSHDPMILGNVRLPNQFPPLSSILPFSHEGLFAMREQAYPVRSIPLHRHQARESSVMNIQITNVTSLPPEEFGAPEPQSPPVSSSLNTTPEIVDVESDNEEISYHLSMAEKLKQASLNQDQGNLMHQPMIREKRPAPAPALPVHENEVHNSAIPNVISADSKRPRTNICPDRPDPPVASSAEAKDPTDVPYGRGVCLGNAAIVSVLGKEFILPLPEESRVKVNSTWEPEYDGDAGTKPAGETERNIRCPSRCGQSLEMQSAGEATEYSCESNSVNGDSTTESDAESITARASPGASADYSDRLKSFNSISLKDLKFRVFGNNSLKMTVNDVFTMNLDLDTGQRLRPGPKSEVVRRMRYGSSLVRRSSSAHQSKIEPETNGAKSPTRASNFSKSPERRKARALKENLAPMAETYVESYSPSPERTAKRARLDKEAPKDYYTRQRQIKGLSNFSDEWDQAGTSRDGLKVLSRSLNNQRRASVDRQKFRGLSEVNPSCNISEDKEGFPISIELSRIQPLLLSKPALFEGNEKLLPRELVKFHSISDLRSYRCTENYTKGILRRSRSMNNLLSSSDTKFLDINLNDDRINHQRRGHKRKIRSFEEQNCI